MPRRLTLRQLADREDRVHAYVEGLVGDPAARDRTLLRAGVYRWYAKLFRVYVRRGGDGVEGAEAFRRATFLYWCASALPGCLTGVDELAESHQEELLADLERYCEAGALDAQLRWMLAHYHARSPAVFGRHPELRALQGVLRDTGGDEWRCAEPEARQFRHRGLMGHYWTHVLRAR